MQHVAKARDGNKWAPDELVLGRYDIVPMADIADIQESGQKMDEWIKAQRSESPIQDACRPQ